MSEDIARTLSCGTCEKELGVECVEDEYIFLRRSLGISISTYVDGPLTVWIRYDGECVFYADEESSYHNRDIHAKDAMKIETEENAFFEGTWRDGKPEWLKEIEKLHTLARKFEDRKEKLEQKALNNHKA